MELTTNEQLLFNDVTNLIEQGRQVASARVNNTLIFTFWSIGQRINRDVLQNKRAEYGKQIVITLTAGLTKRYGRTYDEKNLRRMMQFAERFSDFEIVVPLARQLSWSHFIALLPVKDNDAFMFYGNEAATRQLGKRDLREIIRRKDYERREIANSQVPLNSPFPFNAFKDPYLLDFAGLKGAFQESDLEAAIVSEIGKFIMEAGKGFTFVEQQKRMTLDGKDFYLDLLFFQRTLKRLVAVELKLGEFEPEYKGQMELYLNWLDKYERQTDENAPIGIILCAGASREVVELMQLHKDNIVVAEYWTELPPKAEFEHKIRELLEDARERVARRNLLLGREASHE